MTLHEVARRVGLRQPSLYVYVSSKLDLYDAMFAQANAELWGRIQDAGETGDARQQLLRLSRVILEFAVEEPARQQLLFTRTIPGFAPTEASLENARRVIGRAEQLLSELGRGTATDVEIYTAVIAGLGAQQVANDPNGSQWTRHLEVMLDLVLDHLPDAHQSA